MINEQVARLPSYSFSTLHGFTLQSVRARATYMFPCDLKHDMQNTPQFVAFCFLHFVPCTVPCHRMQPQSKCVNMLLEYVVEGERYLIVRGKYTHTHTHTQTNTHTHTTHQSAADRRHTSNLDLRDKRKSCTPSFIFILHTPWLYLAESRRRCHVCVPLRVVTRYAELAAPRLPLLRAFRTLHRTLP